MASLTNRWDWSKYGFIIDFGDVPCDGYVEFEIDRLDLHT